MVAPYQLEKWALELRELLTRAVEAVEDRTHNASIDASRQQDQLAATREQVNLIAQALYVPSIDGDTSAKGLADVLDDIETEAQQQALALRSINADLHAGLEEVVGQLTRIADVLEADHRGKISAVQHLLDKLSLAGNGKR